MKTDDVLEIHAAGEKNFRDKNLRKQSFKGKDLSGADFSNADIRGADFSNANLTDAKFSGVKAGLPPVWAVFWMLASLLMLGLSGVVASFASTFIIFLFMNSRAASSRVIAVVALAGIVAVLIAATSKVLNKYLGLIALALAFTLALAITFTVIEVATGNAKTGSAIFIVAGAFAAPCIIACTFARTAAFAIAAGNTKSGLVAIVIALLGDITGVFLATSAIGGDPSIARNLAGLVAVSVTLLGAYIGWKSIAEEDRYPLIRRIALAITSTGGTNFCGADLTNADFTQSQLKNTDFSRANIKHTRWYKSQNLAFAIVGNSILTDISVRELLVSGNGYKKDYAGKDIKDANLNGANLEGADLEEADISGATLQAANLKEVNLKKTQSLGTDFRKVYLTGACLEAWNIDFTTQLGEVDCQYVYLLKDKRERLPHNLEEVFVPGDFEKLYKKVINTVQILLRNGINPEAFRVAIDKMIKNNPEINLDSIQAIEKKDGDVLVSIKVPKNANKNKLVRSFNEDYGEAIKQIVQSIKALSEKLSESRNNTFHFHSINQLGRLFMLGSNEYNQSNSIFGIGKMSGGEIKEGAKVAGIINEAQQKTFAEAAAEIQALLEQLEKSYSTDTTTGKMALATEAITQIENNPTLTARILSALQVGSVKAFEQLLSHPAASFVIGALEDWQKTKQNQLSENEIKETNKQ